MCSSTEFEWSPQLPEGPYYPNLLAAWLRACRGERDLSIRDVARACRISPGYLSRLESCAKHSPSRQVQVKLASALSLDPLEESILEMAATRPDTPFAPALDVNTQWWAYYQRHESRIEAVYVVSRDVPEARGGESLEVVCRNIQTRHVPHVYVTPSLELSSLIRLSIEARVGVDKARETLTCITSNLHFAFSPGFVIAHLKDPEEVLGLYAKWFQGAQSRIYPMDQNDARQKLEMMNTLVSMLRQQPSFKSEQFGHVEKVYPESGS